MRNPKNKIIIINNRDEDRTGTYKWLDGFTPANYINIPSHGRGNHYGLIDENSGEWVTKNSLTFEARGLCSRAGKNNSNLNLFSYLLSPYLFINRVS